MIHPLVSPRSGPLPPRGRRLSNGAVIVFLVVVLLLAAGSGIACSQKREGRPETKTPVGADRARAGVGRPLPPDWLKTEREFPASPELTKLIAKFEANPDDKSRQWTLAAMGQLGEPAAVVWLARLAASDDRLNRWAEDALASIKNRHSGLELGDVATSEGPPRVRAAAIRALAASGDLAQAAQLSALVANPDQPLLVRQACAIALGALGRPSAVPALETALTGALADSKMSGQQFRVTLIQALGRIGTEGARGVLRTHAKRDLSPTERRIVEGALEPSAPASPAGKPAATAH
jgi:HEAT repeat protein